MLDIHPWNIKNFDFKFDVIPVVLSFLHTFYRFLSVFIQKNSRSLIFWRTYLFQGKRSAMCTSGGANAGRTDAGRTDAGRTDAGRTDAWRTDA